MINQPPHDIVGVVTAGPYKGWNVRIDRRERHEHLVSVWRGEFDLYPVLDDTSLALWLAANPTHWSHPEPPPPIGVEGVFVSGGFEGDRVLIQSLPSDEGGYVVVRWSEHAETTATETFDDTADLLAWYTGVEVNWPGG